MSQQFGYELARSHPVALVRPHGVLDAYSAADLRVALLECLAAQPVAVVVDVSEVSLVDDLAVTVLAGAARQASHWPGTVIAVAGADDGFTAALVRLGVRASVQIHPDVASAVAAAELTAPPPSSRRQMWPDRYAPALAREVVQKFCERVGISREVAAAQLIASELVTNAVLHAGTPIDFTVRSTGGFLQIAVGDTGPGRVRLAGVVDEAAEHGRGLVLVDALAAHWGTLLPRSGKIVWATVRVRALFPRDGEQVGQDLKQPGQHW